MDRDKAQEATNALLNEFAITMDGVANYHLENGRIIQLMDHSDDMDEEDFIQGKPCYSIALLCSIAEWDCPHSKYYASHSPSLKFIRFGDPDTNILYMVMELMMINEATPLVIN